MATATPSADARRAFPVLSSSASRRRPLFKATPTGFLPEEDQGAFFVEVRLPDGATLGRTSTATAEVEDILRGMPAISDVTTVLGYSMLNGLAQSNSAFMIALLKPFAEREDPSMQVNALLNSVRRQTIGMRQAVVVPFNLPAIIGLSTTEASSTSFRTSRAARRRISLRRCAGSS